jgi:hypothetical protein
MQPLLQPAGKMTGIRCRHRHQRAGVGQGLEPGGFLLLLVQAGARQQQQQIRMALAQQFPQPIGAGLVELVRQVQLDDLAGTEQAQGLAGIEHGVPVQALVGVEAVAFVEALGAGRPAQFVERLQSSAAARRRR